MTGYSSIPSHVPCSLSSQGWMDGWFSRKDCVFSWCGLFWSHVCPPIFLYSFCSQSERLFTKSKESNENQGWDMKEKRREWTKKCEINRQLTRTRWHRSHGPRSQIKRPSYSSSCPPTTLFNIFLDAILLPKLVLQNHLRMRITQSHLLLHFTWFGRDWMVIDMTGHGKSGDKFRRTCPDFELVLTEVIGSSSVPSKKAIQYAIIIDIIINKSHDKKR